MGSRGPSFGGNWGARERFLGQFASACSCCFCFCLLLLLPSASGSWLLLLLLLRLPFRHHRLLLLLLLLPRRSEVEDAPQARPKTDHIASVRHFLCFIVSGLSFFVDVLVSLSLSLYAFRFFAVQVYRLRLCLRPLRFEDSMHRS